MNPLDARVGLVPIEIERKNNWWALGGSVKCLRLCCSAGFVLDHPRQGGYAIREDMTNERIPSARKKRSSSSTLYSLDAFLDTVRFDRGTGILRRTGQHLLGGALTGGEVGGAIKKMAFRPFYSDLVGEQAKSPFSISPPTVGTEGQDCVVPRFTKNDEFLPLVGGTSSEDQL